MLGAMPEDPEDKPDAEFSSQWFAYIAVGITVVAMLVGLALMIGAGFLFFHGLR